MTNIDLTKVNERSMVYLMQERRGDIRKSCETGSVQNIYECVSNIFRSANLDTSATQRLLKNIKNAKSANVATFAVYNSMLAGSGLGVIQK